MAGWAAVAQAASAVHQMYENRKEAAKNRDWQQDMSNTAHQREVADLRAAGLNPILSGTGGSGASTPGGALTHPAPDIGGSAMQGYLSYVQAKQIKQDTKLKREQEITTREQGYTEQWNQNVRDKEVQRIMQDIENMKVINRQLQHSARTAHAEADIREIERDYKKMTKGNIVNAAEKTFKGISDDIRDRLNTNSQNQRRNYIKRKTHRRFK